MWKGGSGVAGLMQRLLQRLMQRLLQRPAVPTCENLLNIDNSNAFSRVVTVADEVGYTL